MKWMQLVLLASALGLSVACGSDEDEGSETPAASEPGSTSKEVTAEEGGEVTLGSASLDIPPGALEDDTTVTVESTKPKGLPEADSLTGLVYDFGPDGTTFSKPVALKLPFEGKLAEDEEAVVSWLDEEKDVWVDVKSTIKNGEVSAEIEHFTKFIVRVRGTQGGEPVGGEIDCDFAACGGDIVGNWEIKSGCFSVDTGEGDELAEFCPGASLAFDISISGSVEFKRDDTFASQIALTPTLIVEMPGSCVQKWSMNMAEDCDALGEVFNLNEDQDGGAGTPPACTGDLEGTCRCTQQVEADTDSKTGTYSVSGNELTMMDDGEDQSEAKTSEFCAKDGELRVHMVENEDDGGSVDGVWIATK